MFQVGDHVVAVCNCPSDNDEIKAGSTGVVCHISEYEPPIGVNWEDDIYGHDCGGACEYGHGWYVYGNEISLGFSDYGSFVCADEQDLDELLT